MTKYWCWHVRHFDVTIAKSTPTRYAQNSLLLYVGYYLADLWNNTLTSNTKIPEVTFLTFSKNVGASYIGYF